jgi:hypothetical protein
MKTLLDELDLLYILETLINVSVDAVDAADITTQDKVKKKEQLKKRDKKCKSQIVQRVADSHLEYVKDKETAFEIWTERNSEKLTLSFVRTRLCDEDKKREGKQRKSKTETQPPLAFATQEGTKQKLKNERGCHNCGKYGHYRSECRLNKSRSEHQQKLGMLT